MKVGSAGWLGSKMSRAATNAKDYTIKCMTNEIRKLVAENSCMRATIAAQVKTVAQFKKIIRELQDEIEDAAMARERAADEAEPDDPTDPTDPQ